MHSRWVGSTCAAVLVIAVFAERVDTQSAAPGPPDRTSAGQNQSPLPVSENPGNRQKVTLEGCLAREADAGPSGEQYVLRSAQLMPQDADPAAPVAASGASDSSKPVSTSGAAADAAASTSGPKPPEAPAPELKAYRLLGDRERGIAPWVGHRVTIVGLLDPSTRGDGEAVTIAEWTAGAAPAPNSGAQPGERVTVRIDGSLTVLSLMPAEKACTAGSD